MLGIERTGTLIIGLLSFGLAYGQEGTWEQAILASNELIRQDRLADAEVLLLREVNRLPGTDSRLSISLNNLGILYLRQGKLIQAEQSLQRAVRVLEAITSADDPGLVRFLNNLARVYNAEGQHARAEAICRRGMAISGAGNNQMDAASMLLNLAAVRVAGGDHAGAKSLAQEALATLENSGGQGQSEIAVALNNLACINLSSGQYEEAQSQLERCISIWEKSSDADQTGLVVPLLNLARVWRYRQRPAAAEALLKRALGIAARIPDSPHPRHPELLEEYSSLLKEQKRKGEARQMLQAARSMRRERGFESFAPTVDFAELAAATGKGRKSKTK